MEELMQLFLDVSGISGIISGVVTFIVFWGVLISAIQAFFGYKLMRLWIIVEGVTAGALAGMVFGSWIRMNISYSAAVGWLLFGFFVGAVLGGYLAYKFWKVGVFILCFCPCFLVGFVMFSLMFSNMTAGIWLGIAVGGVGGYFAVKYVKPVVIIVTSAVNGLCAGLLLSALNPAVGVIAALICIFGGFYFQCTTNGNVFGMGTGKLNFKNSFINRLNESEPGVQAVAVEEKKKPEVSPQGSQGEPGALFKRNSKLRSNLTTTPIRMHNDGEYFFKNAPIVLPQVQIADIDMEGNIGLYLSIQNITGDKRVVAAYFDINCYNVLKEKMGELKNIPILDLSIQPGGIANLEKAIALPERSVRKCELIPRHVVFSDDGIWNYEGDEAFIEAPVQAGLTFSHPELAPVFEKDIKSRTSMPADTFTWQPSDFGDCWYCGCGQFNTASECVFCGMEKTAMFEAADESHLEALYQESLAELAREQAQRERQEEERRRLKEERDAERKRKIAELQGKTISALGVAAEKGKETIQKAGSVSQQAVGSLKKQAEGFSQKNREGQSSTVRCPKCSAECPRGDKFCKKCGAPLQIQGKRCKRCGHVNESDSVFCMNCGAPFAEDGEK